MASSDVAGMNGGHVDWPNLRFPPINLWVMPAWRKAAVGMRIPSGLRSNASQRSRQRKQLMALIKQRTGAGNASFG